MGEQSKTGKRILEELCKIGLFPEAEYKISRMSVDIAFPALKVAFEIDGPHHLIEAQKRIDGRRDDFLQSKGWKVRRFTAKEAYENPEFVAIQISNFLNRVTNPLPNNRKRHIRKVKSMAVQSPESFTPLKKHFYKLLTGTALILFFFLLTYSLKEFEEQKQQNGASLAIIEPAWEQMWSDLKIGDTARDFHMNVLDSSFEEAQYPFENSDLTHFEIRRHYSEPFQIHVYFNGKAYQQNGDSWSPTGALIIRKELHSGGKVIRQET